MKSPSQAARMAVILYSLSISGFLIVFLILAQPLGLRFDYGAQQNMQLIDVVLPTFFGYLGAASHFLFNANCGREIDEQNAGMLRIIIHGPFIVFIAAVAALFYAHQVSLTPHDPRIEPMEFTTLSWYLAVCLALLAATVGIISSYLFGAPPREEDKPKII